MVIGGYMGYGSPYSRNNAINQYRAPIQQQIFPKYGNYQQPQHQQFYAPVQQINNNLGSMVQLITNLLKNLLNVGIGISKPPVQIPIQPPVLPPVQPPVQPVPVEETSEDKINDAKLLIKNYIDENPELSKLTDNLENANIFAVEDLQGKAKTSCTREETKIQLNQNMVDSSPVEAVATYMIHELLHADLHDVQNGEFKNKTNSQWEEAEAFKIGYELWGNLKDDVAPDENNKFTESLNDVYEQYYIPDRMDEYAQLKYKDLSVNPELRQN